MSTLTLQITPGQPALGLLAEQQLCYILLTVGARGSSGARPVNWALVADASRSMRIPIVDEAQFRELLRQGAAQETLVDGVPVWQLSGPVPPEIRASAPSALEFVARALHSVVERLDDRDRFALVACAEEALLLTRSTAGSQRVVLVEGIARLKALNLGERTDLARGLDLALGELRRGRGATDGAGRVDRLLLLTDGFTERPEECTRLARAAAAEGVAISTIGLGGEFQEDVLAGMADSSAGRAIFLRKADGIPRAIADELSAARATAARDVRLRATLEPGVALRRITRIRPTLTALIDEQRPSDGDPAQEARLGDIEAGVPTTLLLELLAPPRGAGMAALGRVSLSADGAPAAEAQLTAIYQGQIAPAAPEVLDAAARANAARLHVRALETAARGDTAGAARLMRAAAARLDALGERALAQIARGQASAIEQGGTANPLAAKELAYATRRLGG